MPTVQLNVLHFGHSLKRDCFAFGSDYSNMYTVMNSLHDVRNHHLLRNDCVSLPWLFSPSSVLTTHLPAEAQRPSVVCQNTACGKPGIELGPLLAAMWLLILGGNFHSKFINTSIKQDCHASLSPQECVRPMEGPSLFALAELHLA